MQPQVAPPVQALRLDPRSVIAAGLCVLALFFNVLGWVFAIAGIVLLRRAAFGRIAKLLLAALAIGPKILFLVVRSMNVPAGLSFPIEPRNLATSSSLWAWCILLAAFGVFIMVLPQRFFQGPRPRRSVLAGLGLVAVAVAAVLLLGLTDGFHRIDDAGGGRWALRHAARGNVAIFSAREVAWIEAAERYRSRGPRDYSVRVALADGRSFSVTTKSSAALDELRKFATTANLARGKVRINRRGGGTWVSGGSGFTLKDCVGRYELADRSGAFEFRMDGERLAGEETEGGRVRVLRNIKVSDNGGVEFEPANYLGASQQEDGKIAISLGWSSSGQSGRFVGNGFETGGKTYRKR